MLLTVKLVTIVESSIYSPLIYRDKYLYIRGLTKQGGDIKVFGEAICVTVWENPSDAAVAEFWKSARNDQIEFFLSTTLQKALSSFCKVQMTVDNVFKCFNDAIKWNQ